MSVDSILVRSLPQIFPCRLGLTCKSPQNTWKPFFDLCVPGASHQVCIRPESARKNLLLVQESPESDGRLKLSIYQISGSLSYPTMAASILKALTLPWKIIKCLVGCEQMAHKPSHLTNEEENSSMEKVSWAGRAQACLYSSFISMESCHGSMITKSPSVKTLLLWLLFAKELLQVKMKSTGSMSNVCIVILPDPLCENHKEAKLFFTHVFLHLTCLWMVWGKKLLIQVYRWF